MYTVSNNVFPLPSILNQAVVAGPHRRYRIGRFCLVEANLARFNDLLVRLGRTAGPLDRDQLVTAARQLQDQPQDGNVAPACIVQRIQRMEAVARMLTDDEWQAANDAAPIAGEVLGYLRGLDDLIPDWIPQVGRLDDAIVVETAWPQLAGEVACYRDYVRLRQREIDRHGGRTSGFHFDRHDWQQARQLEAEWQAQCRRVRDSSYAPAATSCFRVH